MFSVLPSQTDTVSALISHGSQGQATLWAWLQSSDKEDIQEEVQHKARSGLVGRWRLESVNGSLRLTFVDSLNLPGHVGHVASCSSASLAAVFGEICSLFAMNLPFTTQTADCLLTIYAVRQSSLEFTLLDELATMK